MYSVAGLHLSQQARVNSREEVRVLQATGHAWLTWSAFRVKNQRDECVSHATAEVQHCKPVSYHSQKMTWTQMCPWSRRHPLMQSCPCCPGGHCWTRLCTWTHSAWPTQVLRHVTSHAKSSTAALLVHHFIRQKLDVPWHAQSGLGQGSAQSL